MNKTKASLFKRNKLSWTRRPYPSIMHNTSMSIDECVFFCVSICMEVNVYTHMCVYVFVCVMVCPH
jgi:hypothetical protein